MLACDDLSLERRRRSLVPCNNTELSLLLEDELSCHTLPLSDDVSSLVSLASSAAGSIADTKCESFDLVQSEDRLTRVAPPPKRIVQTREE